MKFNWGTGIVIFFIFFAASMTFAVVSTTNHPPQLVQKDYYALDLNYQDRLVKKQNTAMLSSVPRVEFDAASKSFNVKFPEGMIAQTGTAKCYRSSTTKEDFTTEIKDASSFNIPATTCTTGRWHVELDWISAEGKPYFYETALVVTAN